MRVRVAGLLVLICAAAIAAPGPAAAAPHALEVKNCHATHVANGINITRIAANSIATCERAKRVADVFAHTALCTKKGETWYCENVWVQDQHHHSHCETRDGAETRYLWRRAH